MTPEPPAPTPSPDPRSGGDSPAVRGQDRKLSEALGFGASAPGVTVQIGAAGTREPKKAFTGGRAPDAGNGSDAPSSSASSSASFGAGLGAAGTVRPTGATLADSLVPIPAGSWLSGEEKRGGSLPAFQIDRDPVTHGDYEVFVLATGHRPPLYWKGGRCPEELRDHPVVGVDYFDAVAYARWARKDLPFEDEWERAARGTDGRTYPWGDEPDLAANTARTGIRSTIPVGFYPKNTSPDGCRDMVGNVWELTHTPAPGGGVVVRGGSWFDFALYAKTYFRFASRPEARNGTIGFRCVKRAAVRTDAQRAVSDAEVDAALSARRGRQDPADPTTWTAERRDLVPDFRRLRQLLVSRDEDEAEARRTPAASPNRPLVKRAFAGPGAAIPAPPPVPTPAPAAPAPIRPPAPAPVAPTFTAPAAAPAPARPPAPLPTPAFSAPPPPILPRVVAAPTITAPVPAPSAPAPSPAVVASKPVVAPAPLPPAPAPSTPFAAIPMAPPPPPAPAAPAAAPARVAVSLPPPVVLTPPKPAAVPPPAIRPPPAIPAPIAAPTAAVPAIPVALKPPAPGISAPAPAAAPKPSPEAVIDPSLRVLKAPGAAPTLPPSVATAPATSAATPSAPPSRLIITPSSSSATAPPPVASSPASEAPLPPWAVAKPVAPPAPPASVPTKPTPPAPWASLPTTPPATSAVASTAASPMGAAPAMPASKAASPTAPQPSVSAAASPSAAAPVPPPKPSSSQLYPAQPRVTATPIVPAATPAGAPAAGAKSAADAWGPANKETRPSTTPDAPLRAPTTQAPFNPLAVAGAPASKPAASPGVAPVAAQTFPAEVNVASAEDESPSSLRVALLAMGLLAAAVLVVVGLFRLSDREQVTNVEADARRLGLPALEASAAADAAEPSVMTDERARTTLAELESGGALLFFADPSTAEGIDTAEVAVEMHRRLRGFEGLRVALVVPATLSLAAPSPADAVAVRDELRRRGVTSDLLVLVDPVDEAHRPGLWRRTRFDVSESSAAVLLEDGMQSMRVSPPSPTMPLTRSHVAPLVREALARQAELPAAGDPPADEDPAVRDGERRVDDLRKEPAAPPK